MSRSKKKKKYEPGVSIYVTAFKTKEYIDACLNSLYDQTWFQNHDNWEVLVVCDGDLELFEYLQAGIGAHNFKLFLTPENVGTYIASNSIAKECKYNWILRFDSDDTARPDMIEKLMAAKEGYDALYLHGIRIWDEDGKEHTGNMVNIGQPFMKHEIFDYLGGFQPWLTSGDTELKKRLERFYKVKILDETLMDSPKRTDSLTQAEDTKLRSPLREQFRKIIKYTYYEDKEDARIHYTYSPLIEAHENETIIFI